MTPSALDRFKAVMTLLMSEPEGKAIPLKDLTRRLGWFEPTPDRTEWDCEGLTRRGLELFKDGGIVSCEHAGSDYTYALTDSARDYVARGVFASLGVNAPTASRPKRGH
jgi:hypothetical protein